MEEGNVLYPELFNAIPALEAGATPEKWCGNTN
jgi:hypothetical protein